MLLTRVKRGRTISSMLSLRQVFKAKSKKVSTLSFLREVRELKESIRLGQRLVLMSR